MQRLNLCVIPPNLMLDTFLNLNSSSVFLMVQLGSYELVESILRRIASSECNHVFICGKYNEETQSLLLDIVNTDKKFLFSRYDKLDEESIWDFLYLTRFEFVDVYKFFIPICETAEEAVNLGRDLFEISARVMAREKETSS